MATVRKKPTTAQVKSAKEVKNGADIVGAVLNESAQAAGLNPESTMNADATRLFNDLEGAGALNVTRNADGGVSAFSLDMSPYGEQAFTGVVNGYEQNNNPFLRALKNIIWEYLIWVRQWDDPWATLDAGNIYYGEGFVETFVNPAKAHVYSPQVAEQKVFQREIPDYLAAYHNTWIRVFYKQTLQERDLQFAVTGYAQVSRITNQIVTAMYTGLKFDTWQMKKYLICRSIIDGGVQVITTPQLTKANAEDVYTAMIEATNLLQYPSNGYNSGGAFNWTELADQRMITSAHANALINVSTRAQLFNLSVADYQQMQMSVDYFGNFDYERLEALFTDPVTGETDPWYREFTSTEQTSLNAISAVIMDRRYLIKSNGDQFMDQLWNPEGRYMNYWLHTDDLYSTSPFANMVVLTSETPTVTAVAISPTAPTVSKGQSVNFTATVTGTGVFNSGVTWEVTGTSPLSSGTTINANGLLTVASDETNTSLTVTATSIQDDSKTQQTTVTVAE